MRLAFDTLAFAQRLQSAGLTSEEAASHANAIRDFVIPEMLTKADLNEIEGKVTSIRVDMAAMESRLVAKIETMESRLVIRLGAMMIVAVGALATLIKLL